MRHRVNSDRDVVVDVESTLPVGNSKLYTKYWIYGNADVIITHRFVPGDIGLPDMPRFGLEFTIPEEFEHVEWLGRGPHETYWDRKSGAAIGVYEMEVMDLYHPYIRPQENGNRTDVRWIALMNENGDGLLAVGEQPINFSAFHFFNEDFDEGPRKIRRHTYDLIKRDVITLNLDMQQMGVGGDTSWGALIHEQYTLPSQVYEYKIRLRPFSKKEWDPAELSKLPF